MKPAPAASARLMAAILFALAAAIPSGCGLFAASPEAAPPQAWADAATVVLIDMPNIQRTRARWPQTAAAEAWQDPATDYWRSTQLAANLDEALEKVGVGDLGALADLAEKRATVAISGRTGEGVFALTRIAVVARVDFGSRAAEARAIVREQWPSRSTRKVAIARHNIEITVHGSCRGGFTPCSAWTGPVCWIASSEQALEEAVKRASGQTKGLSPSLSDVAAWRKAQSERRSTDDVFVFDNPAQGLAVLTEAVSNVSRMTGHADLPDKVRAAVKWLGLDALEGSAINLELRGKGVYQRSIVLTKPDSAGLIFLTDRSAPLVTPRWMTTDVNGFSAMRIRSLDTLKDGYMRMFETLFPAFRKRLGETGKKIEEVIGFDPDLALRAFGPEFASVTRPGATLPDMAFLMQIRDKDAMDRMLDALRARQAVPTARKTYKGYHIESFVIGTVGIFIHVAEINDFLMVGTGEGWLRSYIDATEVLKQRKSVEITHPMGKASLLPRLDQPFGPAPEGTRVIARSYNDPAPAYMQLNSSLPLMAPFANMMLQQQGLPPVPEWVLGTIPPLMPFASHAFPTVERVTDTRRGIVTERYSAYEPLADPIAAAAIVIGLRLGLERAARVEREMPR